MVTFAPATAPLCRALFACGPEISSSDLVSGVLRFVGSLCTCVSGAASGSAASPPAPPLLAAGALPSNRVEPVEPCPHPPEARRFRALQRVAAPCPGRHHKGRRGCLLWSSSPCHSSHRVQMKRAEAIKNQSVHDVRVGGVGPLERLRRWWLQWRRRRHEHPRRRHTGMREIRVDVTMA